MQNTNTSLSETTDSTVSRGTSECLLDDEDSINLHQQVQQLNQTIVGLENVLRSKDLQLESLQRDKERLSAELKKQQRCNRSLRQQLEDERYFYQREKDHFNEELENHRTASLSSMTNYQKRQQRSLERAREALAEENELLKKELAEKSETTYNLCIKFLRMKHAKDTLRKRHDELLREYLRVMAEMMEKLDEAREELNIIVSEKFREPLPLSKAKFLQIMQRNARLVHENAVLKAQVQQLAQNLEKLRDLEEKPMEMNVDARIIAKLATCSEKRNGKSAKWLSSAKNVKAVGMKSEEGRSVDQSGDAKIISLIKSRNLTKLQKASSSAPEILSTCQKSSTSTVSTN